MLKDQLHVNIALSLQESVLPAAVSYWGQALRVRRTESKIRLNRKCQQNQVNSLLIAILIPHICFQVFFKSDSLHPYCKNACEPVTMCGEVRVPEEHLEVFFHIFSSIYIYLQSLAL